MFRNLTVLALLFALWVPLASAGDPPTPTPTAPAATEAPAAPAEPAAGTTEAPAPPATTEAPAAPVDAPVATDGTDVATLPSEIPVPEDIEGAVEQGSALVDALTSKEWWLAVVLALGLGIFIGNKVLGRKAAKAASDKTDPGK